MLSYSEIVSEIRRFYYRKVGRNAPEGKGRLLVNWDYIKPQVSTDKNRQEYQDLGIAMRDFKALLTNEIDGSGWASIQNNRMGIYSGKPNAAINDSDEVFSGSDRLVQQATMAFVSRFKTPEAIADEGGLFGNMCLTCVKHRRLLGRDFQQQLDPVLLPSGDSVKNQYYLESRGFHFEDKGDLRMMLERRGQATLQVQHQSQARDSEVLL